VLSTEARNALIKCLTALPAAQATVITLHYLQNVPLRDVARKLKVTPSRVSQLHHQALVRLRQSWQRTQAA
jgi:RNA polymerase sigma factor for flagellar operon FliA